MRVGGAPSTVTVELFVVGSSVGEAPLTVAVVLFGAGSVEETFVAGPSDEA